MRRGLRVVTFASIHFLFFLFGVLQHFVPDNFVVVSNAFSQTSEMSNIKLDISPGSVSAIYFIIFDIFIIAVVDVVLIHIVSALYYRRIHRGIPLEVRSAEIHGVATSLVGNTFSPPNIFAYLVKFALLALVLVIDSNINSESDRSRTSTTRSSTFVYDASDEAWGRGLNRVVERRWEALRQCYTMNDDKNSLTYYPIVFDLLNMDAIDSEIKPDGEPSIPIDESSIQCMATDFVVNSPVPPLARIVGCSQLEDTICFNETAISRAVELERSLTEAETVEIDEGTTRVSFSTQNYDELVSTIWPEYEGDSTLTCLRTYFGIGPDRIIFTACLLIVHLEGDRTLFERWEYNDSEKILTRRFPGPIMNGSIEMGVYQRTLVLHNVLVDLNWQSFSGQLIADGVVYKPATTSFVKLGESKLVTTIPVFSVVLTVVLIIAAAASRIIVTCTIGRDEKPHLNTIDGLSSVAREEHEPTGRSRIAGRHMLIGLSKRDGRSVHFGPLRSFTDGIARDKGEFVE